MTLVTKLSIHSDTRVALQSQCQRTMMKFTLTVPTELPFIGPPITLLDTRHGYIPLPVLPIVDTLTSIPMMLLFPNYQQQFCEELPVWQRILFGSLRKSYNTTHLYNRLCQKIPIMIGAYSALAWNGTCSWPV